MIFAASFLLVIVWHLQTQQVICFQKNIFVWYLKAVMALVLFGVVGDHKTQRRIFFSVKSYHTIDDFESIKQTY